MTFESGDVMLKWDVSEVDEQPARLPKYLYWLAAIVYLGSFTFTLLTWFSWIVLLGQHQQSLVMWGL